MNRQIKHFFPLGQVTLTLLVTSMLFSCNKRDLLAEAQGVFEADEILVASPIDGRIDYMQVKEGEQLTKGQEVIHIDTTLIAYQRDYIASQQANARTSGIVSEKVQTEALDVQIAALEKEQRKIERLVEKEVLAQKQLDEINARLDGAKAQKAAATQQVEKQNSGSQGTAKALDAQIAQVNEMISRAAIKAPISGTVLTTYAHEGELTGAGRPLFKMANLSNITLRIYLSPGQLERIQLGQIVKVYNDMGGEKNREYKGKIVWISEKAEFTPKNIQTSSMRSTLIYAAKVEVPNDGYLKIGQYGKAIIPSTNASEAPQR